jgi:hypothetical protein
MRCDFTRSSQLGENLLRQLLSKLNAPLIKRIDVKNNSLDENLVLIHCNQSTQSVWSELLEHDGVGGTVSFKHFVGQQLLQCLLIHSCEFSARLIRGLSLHQCLSKEENNFRKIIFNITFFLFHKSKTITRRKKKPEHVQAQTHAKPLRKKRPK